MGFWSGLMAAIYGSEAYGEMTKLRDKKKDHQQSRKSANEAAATSGRTYRAWMFRDQTVYAHTKSEARAKFKKLFGPLPSGSCIMKT